MESYRDTPYEVQKPHQVAWQIIQFFSNMKEHPSGDHMQTAQLQLANYEIIDTSVRWAMTEIAEDETVGWPERFIAVNFIYFIKAIIVPSSNRVIERSLVLDANVNTAETVINCLCFLVPFKRIHPGCIRFIELYYDSNYDWLIAIAACIMKRPERASLLIKSLKHEELAFRALIAAGIAQMDSSPEHLKAEAAAAVAGLIEMEPPGSPLSHSSIHTLGELGRHGSKWLGLLERMARRSHTPPETLRHILRAARQIGCYSEDKSRCIRLLHRGLISKNASTVHLSITGLHALDATDDDTINALIPFLGDEDPAVRGSTIVRLKNLGPRSAVAVKPLIDLWFRETEPEILWLIVEAIAAIGTASLDSLFELLKSNNPKIIQLPLQVFVYMEDLPIEEIAERVLTHKDRMLRTSGAWLLRHMGPKAQAVMPTLRSMLMNCDPEIQVDAAIALSGLRHEALPAAPELAVVMAQSNEPVLLHWAAAVLRWIGPSASNEVESALGIATGLGREYLLELRNRFESQAEHTGPHDSDLSWYGNRPYLRIFLAVANILKRQGRTSFDDLSAIIGKSIERGELDESLESSGGKLRLAVKDIETKLTERVGRDIKLLERGRKRSPELTSEGQKFADQIRMFLNRVDNK